MTIQIDRPLRLVVTEPEPEQAPTPLTPAQRYEQRLFDGVIEILRAGGVVRTMWDRDNADEVAAAQIVFATAMTQGSLAYSTTDGGLTGEATREFDPEAQHLVVIPRIVGG